MAKRKKADERSSAHQPKRRPRKGSASQRVSPLRKSVKRLWVVFGPVPPGTTAVERVCERERDAELWARYLESIKRGRLAGNRTVVAYVPEVRR